MPLWILVIVLIMPNGQMKTSLAVAENKELNSYELCVEAGMRALVSINEQAKTSGVELVGGFECKALDTNKLKGLILPSI